MPARCRDRRARVGFDQTKSGTRLGSAAILACSWACLPLVLVFAEASITALITLSPSRSGILLSQMVQPRMCRECLIPPTMRRARKVLHYTACVGARLQLAPVFNARVRYHGLSSRHGLQRLFSMDALGTVRSSERRNRAGHLVISAIPFAGPPAEAIGPAGARFSSGRGNPAAGSRSTAALAAYSHTSQASNPLYLSGQKASLNAVFTSVSPGASSLSG